MKEIKIDTEYITLQQFLKLENIISSGGQAKRYLLENIVYVNGVKETRRGRKLVKNDYISFDGNDEKYKIV